MKPYLITSLASLLLTALIMGLGYGQASLISFINSGATAAIIFFLFGCMIYVVGGGFFNAGLHGMRVFLKKMTREGRMLAEIEGDEDEPFEQKTFKTVFTFPLLTVGAGLFIVTLCLSYAA